MNNPHRTQPRLIEIRKPLRPTRVADARKPVSETKPLSLGGPVLATGALAVAPKPLTRA